MNIQDQWFRWLNKITVSEGLFTKELYEALRQQGNMIAHFNREGFIKARFRTLADFDITIAAMNTSKFGKELIKNTPVDLLSVARYRVACQEANILISQARVIQEHVKNLQSGFSKQII